MNSKNRQIILNITLSSLMIALAVILDRILTIRVPGILGSKVSLGFVPIIITSTVLGPTWGAIVGGLTDVIGFFVFDDTGTPYSPLYTILYIIVGILPYFIFYISRSIRYKSKPFPLLYIILGSIWLFINIYVLLNSQFRVSPGVYEPITTTIKIIVPILSTGIFGGLAVLLYFLNRYFQKKVLFYPKCPNPQEVALVVLLIEIIIHLLLEPLVLMFVYEAPYLPIVFIRAMVLIITIPANTFIVNYALMAYYRYIDRSASDRISEE